MVISLAVEPGSYASCRAALPSCEFLAVLRSFGLKPGEVAIARTWPFLTSWTIT